jgi:predicted homoserine dehydrogenase-like protein
MQIVDTALQRAVDSRRPVRVAMVGAGFMAQGVANQLHHSVPGIDLVVVVARRPEQAEGALEYAGYHEVARVASTAELDAAISRGVPAVTDDHTIVTASAGIDVFLECTGSVHYAAQVVLDAARAGKHIVLMNAELDGTIGPILKAYADAAGVILSACDGDQPGVQANLVRFVRSIGLAPLVVGNIKGLQDRFRNPTTQEGFARQWGQNVHMVTSFADGTKISFEQAIVANAFDLRVAQRGMIGNEWRDHIDAAVRLYDAEELLAEGGIVDYVVGATPSPGVYCFAAHPDPKQQHYLELYKLGNGPLYSFYTPYHLCHFEVPLSLARVALLGDPVMQPLDGPKVDVVAVAKIDLVAGTVLDGLGGYHTYGEAENYGLSRAENLLPIGLAEGCTLVRDVPTDRALTYDDVEVPAGRLADALRAEQDARWPA